MVGGIDVVDAATQDGGGPGFQRALMGRAVNAARHSRNHQIAGQADLARQSAGEPLSGGGSDTGADDGHGRPLQQGCVSQDPDQWGRRVEDGQQPREIRFGRRDQARAKLGARGQFALDLGDCGDPGRVGAAAAARQIGQGGDGAGGVSEARNQLGEGDRADPFGPRQPQPVTPRMIVESGLVHSALDGSASAAAFLPPIRGSWPLSRRAMFSW